ncbi:hypothetical protein KsCSTR_42910 [Candidatus Kuenenia stuttgartiensis]|jgi:hypothetical protein|uniref:Uncharacterized protein n=1 Tax=Kuenenia stuttgartiensis TaxID=174633 RepID=Q1PX90_KUEST|nr:hypothetical protein [Candidatus Kuenenia stuttgartiensis]QII13670.1 hypothetical protein KsCSTR_42910 [Candidatus Kuenenia stuttgartiensis]CAJ71839.1 unknown protein [Candidatus Kuenenia stuttgartiensis]
MEIDILQLIWFVFIVVILLAGIIKRSLNRKSQERFSGNNVRRREESRDINSGKQQGKSGWQDLLDTMYGNEHLPVQTQKKVKGGQRQATYSETMANESAESRAVKSEARKTPEFRAVIEDRHLKSAPEKDVFKSTIQGQRIHSTLSESKEAYKKKTSPKQAGIHPYKIHQKEGPKDAIIFSEIIAPPLALRRKRSLFRHRP